MFIELMFWKNAMVAESVRDEYNWRVSSCYAPGNARIHRLLFNFTMIAGLSVISMGLPKFGR